MTLELERQTLWAALVFYVLAGTVAIFGVVFLGEKLTTPNWLGIALIAVGAVLVAYR